mgnify:CR=1
KTIAKLTGMTMNRHIGNAWSTASNINQTKSKSSSNTCIGAMPRSKGTITRCDWPTIMPGWPIDDNQWCGAVS